MSGRHPAELQGAHVFACSWFRVGGMLNPLYAGRKASHDSWQGPHRLSRHVDVLGTLWAVSVPKVSLKGPGLILLGSFHVLSHVVGQLEEGNLH